MYDGQVSDNTSKLWHQVSRRAYSTGSHIHQSQVLAVIQAELGALLHSRIGCGALLAMAKLPNQQVSYTQPAILSYL